QLAHAWRQGRAWQSGLVAGTVAASAGGTMPGPAGQLTLAMAQAGSARPTRAPEPVLTRVARKMGQNYRATQEPGPAAALSLGVGAARRALAESPEDGETCFVLGRLYTELGGMSRESILEPQVRHVALIRQAQAAAALRQAIQFDPDHEAAH